MEPTETAVVAETKDVSEITECGCVSKTTKIRKPGLGFTNMLAIYLVLLLTLGLAMAFYLAKLSILYNYMGQLLCFTVVFTPLGTAISLVLGKIVDKSRAENTSGDGTGIKYAQAAATGFQQTAEIYETVCTESETSQPTI